MNASPTLYSLRHRATLGVRAVRNFMILGKLGPQNQTAVILLLADLAEVIPVVAGLYIVGQKCQLYTVA